MKKFDVVIIGAGASGVMCAISAKREKSIALIDSGDFPAKKLLVTGNGRCNFTNMDTSSGFYNQNIDNFLERFGPKETIRFFEDIGLMTYHDEELRCYPISNTAKSVVDVLKRELQKRHNISLFCGEKVENIKKDGKSFVIKTTNNDFSAEKLVIATGGMTNMELFQKYDIKIRDFVPSLCALKTTSTKRLSGIRLSSVSVTASCCRQIVKRSGEVLFKDSGLSGIVIFNVSSLFARNNWEKGEVSIDIVPNIKKEVLVSILKERRGKYKTLKNMFVGMFHSEVNKEIIWRSGFQEETKTDVLSDQDIEKIADIIKNFKFEIEGAYDNNQIFAGGVLLSELTENLEARKETGLYFCGEVCDVDGECGGYNLQWAWTSGRIVGESL